MAVLTVTSLTKEGSFDSDTRNAINTNFTNCSNMFPAAPATAAASGTAGQIAYDSTHIYVCVATNTWCRATIATW